MGEGYDYRCKKCGKEGTILLNCGMLYLERQKDFKSDVLKGKLGPDWQKYVQDHPEGWFQIYDEVFRCDCGFWKNESVKDYYLPNESEKEGPRARPILGRHYEHLCPRCGKEMQQMAESEVPDLRCPDCGGELWMGGLYWD